MAETDDRREFFETEIFRLADRLYGTALRLTRNAADAEDLVAETTAKAWAKFGDLDDRRRFEPWIFRILNNTFVSDWRRRRTRADVEVAADVQTAGNDEDECFSLFEKCHQPFLLWFGTPEQEFLNRLLRDDLEKAIDSLPEAFRTVVVLVEIQGRSYAEIAEFLEVPVGTVRSRLNRGRGMLQKALWTHARDAGLVTGAALQDGGRDGR